MPSFEETLTCPVCLDLFDDPRLLPCSHTFCCKCLRSTINSHSFVTCPLCRSRFFGQILPVNRIVSTLVEQIRQDKSDANRSFHISAKCYDCKSYQKLDVCYHCDTLLCNKCHHKHEIDWKNRDYRTNNLLLSKVTWLKFQINFKLRHENHCHLNEKLTELECQIKSHRHPLNRQQYQENKHRSKAIVDELHHIDKQLQERILQHVTVQSPICITPLSAASSGYSSDMN
ncbi:unnamed protein product [Adineta ricciae]|uniref:RING-type domain-containing protein n=1 Tax=Adineta ricciae TaxID=249248 RepID=A0A814LMG5_ADIRI|nr:unnamed protein product [Adineta ricciae]CAF1067197.1 unnamed protein product [Adineta ricciae]